MRKGQRIVASTVLILIGIVSFIFAASTTDAYYVRRHLFEIYLMILLGIAFTGGGIFVLVTKKGR